jgi:hypothetical protein
LSHSLTNSCSEVPYLLGRLSALTSLVLLAIETSPFSGNFACQPGTTSMAISAGIAVGTSSTNLMIRTWVIWKNSPLVHTLLILLTLGHWTILALEAADFKAFRSNGVCIVQFMDPAVFAGAVVYTMCYDLIVLVLSIVKLSRQSCKSPLKDRLRAQGLLYFAVATMANIPPIVCTPHASFIIIYSSLLSTGLFFPWSQRHGWYNWHFCRHNKLHRIVQSSEITSWPSYAISKVRMT